MTAAIKFAMRQNKSVLKFIDSRKHPSHWPHIAYSWKCIDCHEAGAFQLGLRDIERLGGLKKARSHLLGMLLKNEKLKRTGRNAVRHRYCINLDYSRKEITTA